MATSGVYTLTATRNDIIKRALSKLGVTSAFQEPSAEDFEIGVDTFNSYIKLLQKKGLRPTQYFTVTVFIDNTKNKYTLGSVNDHATLNYNQTTTSAAAITGATSIEVSSATGFATNYYVGIVLDNGALQWTTASGVSSTTISLNDALTDDVASGNVVFVYEAKIQQPLKIATATRLSIYGDETPLDIVNRADYFDIATKSISGSITEVHYSPKVNTGELYVYPINTLTTDVLKLDVEYPLEIFTTSTQTLPFPSEWELPLIYNLAYYMAEDFGYNGIEYDKLEAKAIALEAEILSTDVEDNSIQFIVG